MASPDTIAAAEPSMGPGTFNHSDQIDRTQTQSTSDRVTSAQSEVNQLRAASGRMAPTTSTDSAHALFGTPTITGGDAPASTTTGDAHATSATTGVAPEQHTAGTDTNSGTASSKAGQWLPDHLGGALDFTIQGVRGAVQSVGTFGHQVGEALSHSGSAASSAISAAGEAIQHPAAAAEAVGSAIKNGAASVVQAAKDNPWQTAAMIGAVGVDVATLGTASPLLTAVGAVGAAFTTHDVWNAATAVYRDADKISPMFNATGATAQQLKTAQDTAASDIGNATLGVATTATGIGIGLKLSRLEGATSATAAGTASTEETAAASSEVASKTTPKPAANDNNAPTSSDSGTVNTTTARTAGGASDQPASTVANDNPTSSGQSGTAGTDSGNTIPTRVAANDDPLHTAMMYSIEGISGAFQAGSTFTAALQAESAAMGLEAAQVAQGSAQAVGTAKLADLTQKAYDHASAFNNFNQLTPPGGYSAVGGSSNGPPVDMDRELAAHAYFNRPFEPSALMLP